MAINLPFATLHANYYSSRISAPNYVDQQTLYTEIGWEEFLGNPYYENTCATRVSLALLKSGHEVRPGSHRIQKGPYKGKRLQVSMKDLANILAQDHWFGAPEILNQPDPSAAVGARQGIIAFHRLPTYSGGGHIDLIDNSTASLVCASGCYFEAEETWFWPLSTARS
ncbi:MAG: T6SS effector amidase Tae4 family protein [Tropicimonas sp.]|uniref:T6SS effector amidase Tae4 family protein n=1 Tax=Tropicimonas sp. TaxID=2067044 RepID=UPI003A8894CC